MYVQDSDDARQLFLVSAKRADNTVLPQRCIGICARQSNTMLRKHLMADETYSALRPIPKLRLESVLYGLT